MKNKIPGAAGLIRLLFFAAVFAALVTGIGRALISPKDINIYESRPANQLPVLTAESFADMSFQDGTEEALADQLPLAQYFKKAYNSMKYWYQSHVAFPLMESTPDRYYRFKKDIAIFNGMIVSTPENPENGDTELQKVMESYNNASQKLPEAKYYLYYIESENDINFESHEKNGAYENICALSVLPRENIARFEIPDFETYAGSFYSTDHHWCWRGSYRGYTELLRLLGCDDEPLVPVEERTFPMLWHGSKSNALGFEKMLESFTAYRFDLPEMSFTVEGEACDDYGNQALFFDGLEAPINYGNFYGENYAEVIVDTKQSEKENLLIIGDSFTNAVLKPLSAHFNRTVLIDPRVYGLTLSDLDAYIRENDIDKVLFLGYYKTVIDERFVLPET